MPDSIVNIPTPQLGDADWTTFVQQVGTQRRGYINLSVTNLLSTAAPEIQLGSTLDINGSLWECVVQCPVSGWAGISNLTIAYLYVLGAAASWSAVAPAWDVAKGGWYNTNGFRCVGGCWRDAVGLYANKWLYHNPVVNAQGKVTVPSIEVTGSAVFYWQ